MMIRKKTFLVTILILLISCTTKDNLAEKQINSIADSNPIIAEFNQLPDFKNLEPHHIIEARNTADSNVSSMLEQLKSIPNEARTFENTLIAIDDIYDQIYKIKSPIELMCLVHPDDSIRKTAMRESDHLMVLSQKLNHDSEI